VPCPASLEAAVAKQLEAAASSEAGQGSSPLVYQLNSYYI